MKKREFIYVSSFILFILLACQTPQKTTLLPKTKQYLQYEKKFKTILTQLPKDSADIPYGIPIKNGLITSSFGQTNHFCTDEQIFLDYIIFAQYPHVPVLATANGIVTKIYWKSELTIRIKHKYKFETEYTGLFKADVTVGQFITKGTKIGPGCSIHTDSYYTFYRIFHNKIAINPVLMNKNFKISSNTN